MVTPEELGLKKPDAESLQSFTLMDGRKFKLAIISESWLAEYPRADYSYAYMTSHPFYITRGVYSGGKTGGGATDIYLLSELKERTGRIVKFIGWVEVRK